MKLSSATSRSIETVEHPIIGQPIVEEVQITPNVLPAPPGRHTQPPAAIVTPVSLWFSNQNDYISITISPEENF